MWEVRRKTSYCHRRERAQVLVSVVSSRFWQHKWHQCTNGTQLSPVSRYSPAVEHRARGGCARACARTAEAKNPIQGAFFHGVPQDSKIWHDNSTGCTETWFWLPVAFSPLCVVFNIICRAIVLSSFAFVKHCFSSDVSNYNLRKHFIKSNFLLLSFPISGRTELPVTFGLILNIPAPYSTGTSAN